VALHRSPIIVPSTEDPVNTRTIAIAALVIAVLLLALLVL
jgi:hypothetical protein